MTLGDRFLLRGLRPHLSNDGRVLVLEQGRADALGEMRKTTAVLTDESLLLATSARAKTILTVVPRRDIRSVEEHDESVYAITFDDYAHARARVIRLQLKQHSDRDGLIARLRE